MAPAKLLERNVRPAHATQHGDDFDDLDNYEEDEVHSSGESEQDDGEDTASTSEDSGHELVSVERAVESATDPADAREQFKNVSFGALKEAQDAMSRKRKRGSDTISRQDENTAAFRSRFPEGKSKMILGGGQDRVNPAMHGHRQQKAPNFNLTPTQEDDGESSEAPSEEETTQKSRTSKHAPASRSSRYQVTRKRTVIEVPKRISRDPRFDATQQGSVHSGNHDKAYSFLRDYEKDEIAELKAATKRTNSEEDKETLRRKVISMENRIKSQEAKERQQSVLRQHRKDEKAKVEQGKKPFYLKEKDLKERAVVEKFKGMKGKEREKLMEKRRRKESQREIKRMPEPRRFAG